MNYSKEQAELMKAKGQEAREKLGLDLTQAMCEPVKTEDETVAEVVEVNDDAAEDSSEVKDEITEAVITADETVDYVAPAGSQASQLSQVISAQSDITAPHTGLQSGAMAGLGLIGLSATIALTAIFIKR